jgi:hypothetical protein
MSRWVTVKHTLCREHTIHDDAVDFEDFISDADPPVNISWTARNAPADGLKMKNNGIRLVRGVIRERK